MLCPSGTTETKPLFAELFRSAQLVGRIASARAYLHHDRYERRRPMRLRERFCAETRRLNPDEERPALLARQLLIIPTSKKQEYVERKCFPASYFPHEPRHLTHDPFRNDNRRLIDVCQAHHVS